MVRSWDYIVAAAVSVVVVIGALAAFATREIDGSPPPAIGCPDGTPLSSPIQPPEAFLEEAHSHPEFGGTYILQECFALVVLTTGDLETFEMMAGRHFVPIERFIVGRTTYTYRELEVLQAEVVADRDEWLAAGIDIQTVEVDVALNRVGVGILEPSDDARRELEDRYGERIVVV